MVEGVPTPKYQVDIDGAQAVVIGDGSVLIQEAREQWLVEESLDDVCAGSFVPPSQGEALVQTLWDQHLLVLCGSNRMGKAALARYVASCLQERETSRQVFRMQRRSELQDLVDVLGVRQNLIVLAYDVEPSEAEEILQNVREMALNAANFVILTSDIAPEDWHVPPEYSACMAEVVVGSPYTKQDLERLLAMRLGEHLRALQKEHGVSTRSLVDVLASPSQIVRFSDMLLAQPKPPDAAGLRELIQTIQDVRLEVGSWFRGLEKNERYLALALALFDDLPEQYFWALYERMVDVWQERDFTLLPLDYYALDAFKAFISLGSRIAFQEADYRDAVLDLFLGKYRRSLVATLPLLQRVAVESRRRHGSYDRTTRIAVAQAVGQIGTLEWSETEAVLLAWAAHLSKRVRAATSHAFRQMLDYLGVDILQDILGKLDNWLDANTPPGRDEDTPQMCNIRWTVASSLGRIGRIVSGARFEAEILPRLNDLSWDENFQVRKSVVYALRRLGLSRFPDVRGILDERAADWHEEVRLEVANTLCELSFTRWQDVRDLLHEWLGGNNSERQRTAFWTVLRVGKDRPSAADELYAFTNQNRSLRSTVQNVIVDLLRGEEQRTDEVSTLLEVLVRREHPTDSYLLIAPLVYALDYRFSTARDLVTSWRDSSRPELVQVAHAILQQLEVVRADRGRRWEIMLTQYLDDDEELRAFAATLPPFEREVFWRDVRTRREERRRKQRRSLHRAAIAAVVALFLLCLFYFCMCPLFSSCQSSWNR